MITVKIKDDKHRVIAAKIRQIGKGMVKPRALYARWGVIGLKWIDDNFRTEGRLLEDGPWPPLAPSTLRARRSRGSKSTKILQVTGKMRRGFTSHFDSNGVVLKGTAGYEIFHESDRPRHRLPQRRMLPRQRDRSFMERIMKATATYVSQLIRRSR